MDSTLRQADPDRWFTTLFAPPAARPALTTLYLFNHELARAREVARREPALAHIRLHWWREVLDGARRSHEVAGPLGALLDEGRLPPDLLHAMIDAREAEAVGPAAGLEAFLVRMRQGPGSLMRAAGALLDGGAALAAARLEDLGAACGVAGTLRNVPAQAAMGRCDLPEAVLAAAGLTAAAVVAAPQEGLRAAGGALIEAAGALLASRQLLPGAVVPAALPAVFARTDIAGMRRRGAEIGLGAAARGLRPRLAVLRAAVTKSV